MLIPICGMSNIRPKRKKYFSTTRCIKTATFSEAKGTLELDLNGANLKIGSKYILSIPAFEGRAQIGHDYSSDGGFFTPSEDKLVSFSISSTLFQMRFAREAFPCFDQPALKAKFELCMERPKQIMVASNTPFVPTKSKMIGNNRKRDCFEPTPIMSTYLFAFALMQNYSSQSIQARNGGPIIEVFGQLVNLTWILEESIPAIRYMEQITKFKFPLKRLSFVVINSGDAGMENFGFITLLGDYRNKIIGNIVTVYHEIVHQWIGNVVRISEWSEICLQEGLTSYFAWKITADLQNNISLDEQTQLMRSLVFA